MSLHAVQLHREPIAVSFEYYEHAEFLRWSAGDGDVVDRMLSRTGRLGRKPSVIHNQLGDRMQGQRKRREGGGYNYAEVKYAELLVERGWPKDNIVYENYYLSRRALQTSSGLTGKGCVLVRKVFTDAFSEAFDELIDKNPKLFEQTVEPKNVRVDLFAMHQSREWAGLWEVKRFNPETKATEAIGHHQRAVLAFTTYLAREFPGSMLRNPATAVEVGLVVFLPVEMSEAERDRAVAETDRYCEFVV